MFPITKLQLIDSVQILVKNFNRENNFNNGRPGKKTMENDINDSFSDENNDIDIHYIGSQETNCFNISNYVMVN